MQSRRAIKKHRPIFDHIFECFPDFRSIALDQAARTLDVRSVTILNETRDNERAIEFESHGLRQTALIKFELRTNNDHGTTGIIHALAKQVSAEAAFLAFEHIAQRFELAAAAAAKRLAALGIVNEAIHRFLQHALLIADDDVRRAQFKQTLEAVVAVDHAAIQIVQV